VRKIYKYPLSFSDRIVVDGSIICPLTVQMQNGVPCLWTVVDDSLPSRSIEVRCVGTGMPLTRDIDNMIYISTVQVGKYVFHYFYKYIQEWGDIDELFRSDT
jgi:hypothetical protein